MTLTDSLIPYYVRFQWGYGYISLLLALASFGMSIITMITVKGIYIPLWLIPVVGCLVILLCVGIGYFCEKFDIQNRMSSHSNKTSNPEFKKLCEDIEMIKRKVVE